MSKSNKLPELPDYTHWVSLNSDKHFGMSDYIYGIFTSKSLAPDIFVAFLNLFWPEFIEKDDYVFIKDIYSEEKYVELIDENTEPKLVEYWMNIFEVDSFFTESEDFSSNSEFFEFCKYIGDKLNETWSAKLKTEYPQKIFNVECITDAAKNEVFVVFHQK